MNSVTLRETVTPAGKKFHFINSRRVSPDRFALVEIAAVTFDTLHTFSKGKNTVRCKQARGVPQFMIP